MTTTLNFKTGSSFILNGETCIVTAGNRVNVAYRIEHSEAEATYHSATRAALKRFVAAGLIK